MPVPLAIVRRQAAWEGLRRGSLGPLAEEGSDGEADHDANRCGVSAGREHPARARTYAGRAPPPGRRPLGAPSALGSCIMIELISDKLSVPFRDLRYLVVDDDVDQRYLVARTLNRMGMADVVEASSGRGALDALAQVDKPVDVVISDLQMPDIDGMELIRRIGERAPAGLGDSGERARRHAAGFRSDDDAGLRRPHHRHDRETRHPGKALYRAPAVRSAARRRRQLARQGISARTRTGPRRSRRRTVRAVLPAEGGARTGRVVGAEALARWRHPAYGLLGSGGIPAAARPRRLS